MTAQEGGVAAVFGQSTGWQEGGRRGRGAHRTASTPCLPHVEPMLPDLSRLLRYPPYLGPPIACPFSVNRISLASPLAGNPPSLAASLAGNLFGPAASLAGNLSSPAASFAGNLSSLASSFSPATSPVAFRDKLLGKRPPTSVTRNRSASKDGGALR